MDKLMAGGIDFSKLSGILYSLSRHPGNVSVDEFLANPELGANCQLFTLGVLRKAGFYIDDKMLMDQGGRFGSKELWLDEQYTEFVKTENFSPESIRALHYRNEMHVFDIYFFLPPGIDPCDMGCGVDEELLKKLHTATFTGFDLPDRDSRRAFFHNAKPGPSAFWSLSDFTKAGYSLVGIKRPTQKIV